MNTEGAAQMAEALSAIETQALEAAQRRLASGEIYRSADAYYADKDLVRHLTAKSLVKSEREHDPMGFWFGHQSN